MLIKINIIEIQQFTEKYKELINLLKTMYFSAEFQLSFN